MKKILKKNKWLISIFIFVIVVTLFIVYLYYTHRLGVIKEASLNYFYKETSTIEKGVIGFSIVLLIWELFKGWLSNFIFGYVFPGLEKETFDNTEKILSYQKKFSNQIELLAQNSKIDTEHLTDYISKLNKYNSEKEKISHIEKWFQEDEINLNYKNLLTFTINAIFEYSEKIGSKISESETPFSSSLKEVKTYLKGNKPAEIEKTYFKLKNQHKNEIVEFLKISIESTELLYAFDETKRLYKELIEKENTDENHFNYSCFLYRYHHLDEALQHFKLTLEIIKENYPDSAMKNLMISGIISNISTILYSQGDFKKALITIKEGLSKIKNRQIKKSEEYLIAKSSLLITAGNIYRDKFIMASAIKSYKKTIKLRKKLVNINNDEYSILLAEPLNNLAILYMNQNKLNLALTKFNESLRLKQDYKRSDYDIALIHNNLGIINFKLDNFQQSNIAFDKALKITRNLVKENPRIYSIFFGELLINYSALKAELNELDTAIKFLKESKTIFQNETLTGDNEVLPQLAGAHFNLANVLLKFKDKKNALSNYTQSLNIYEDLIKIDKDLYEVNYAEILFIGFLEFDKGIENIYQARRILKRHRNNYKAKVILKIISHIK